MPNYVGTLAKGGLSASDLAAIGITNPRETLIIILKFYTIQGN